MITMPEMMAGLPARRKAAGLTQQQLADALDVERGTVSMWEIGKSWPPARMLPGLADLLLCTIDDLYHAPEDKNNGPPRAAAPTETEGDG